LQDIYKQRSTWKIILLAAGGLILLITLYYSNFLAQNLMKNEEKNAKLWISSLEYMLANNDLNEDVSLRQDIINEFSLPSILEYSDGNRQAYNFNDTDEVITDKAFIDKKIKEFLDSGEEPLRGNSTTVYYFHSKLVTYIKFFPLVQILLIGTYIGIGYFLFNSSRRAEQNRVWAGMAKETAHQLGTPISAMLGWMSYLREISSDSPEHLEVVDELEKDVDRLNLVADRFSKIGSLPELKPYKLYDVISEGVDYMQRRSPKHINFEITDKSDASTVLINDHLFQWVIENLLRNAIDAMDGKGKINCSIYKTDEHVCLDIADTGKGIPASKFKTVFQPGYSTKKRGWGLGLSLAKRIVENYHKGKIFVKSSRPGEGTTFTVKLPKTLLNSKDRN
jgi:two-component sensor histidine kinase